MINREIVLDRIVDVLQKEKELSITNLSNKLEMNRTTLKYYLEFLEKRNIISRKRIEEKEKGRPMMIIFNSVGYDKWKDNILHDDIGNLKSFILHIIDIFKLGLKSGRVKKQDYDKFKQEIINSLN
jgi:predicted transcriptional regulator